MKSAIVFGAGGFIGGHLFKKLKNEGFWVRGRNSDNRLIGKLLNWSPKESLRLGLVKTYDWILAEINRRHNSS